MTSSSPAPSLTPRATLRAVCVYCGSRPGARPEYLDAAREMGRALAARGLTLVYGAGSTGMMGAVADATLEAGGQVIGVIPTGLDSHEQTHRGLSQLHVVRSMHERKALMESLSDALVALPGGFGTMDELFEALTWGVLGIHKKPCGLLNTARYWEPVLQTVDHMLNEGFITQGYRDIILRAESPDALLDALVAWEPDTLTVWRT